jgi:O-antigen/teichoic acid export membrane protein
MMQAAPNSRAPRAVEEDASQSGQQILQNGVMNLAVQLLYAGLQLVIVFLLVRQLGAADLGRYYTLVATILTAQLVIEGGAGTVLTQQLARSGADWKDRVDGATGLFGVIMLVSMFGFVVTGAVWTCVDGSGIWVICLLAAGISCGAMQVQRFCISIFQASELFRPENVAKMLQIAMFLSLLLCLLAGTAVNLGSVFLSHAISHIAASIYLFATLRRYTGPLAWRLNLAMAARQWFEAIPLGIADVLRRLTWQVDTIVLALLTTPGVVGVYSVAYRALGPLNWIPRALLSAAFPSLARTAGDREKTSRAFARSTRLLLVISIPIAVAVCACAEPLVEILAGRGFEEAAELMKILIWTIVLSFTSVQFRFLFTALKQQRVFVWLTALVLLFKVILEVLLIPSLGYYGACLGSLAAESALFVGGLLVCRSLGVEGVEWRAVGRALLAGMIIAALLWTARGSGLVVLGLALVLAAVLYMALCAALGAVKRDEIEQYVLLLRRLFRLPAKGWTT